MKTNMMAMAAASLAMAATGPALAQQTGKQNRTEARQNSQGPSNAAQRGVQQSNENSVLKGGTQPGGEHDGHMKPGDDMRSGSQGRANASDRALSRANQNSALANIQPGMMVHDRNGRMLGKVQEIKRSPTGVVVLVVVVLNITINGSNIVQLSPASLTIINNILVTTQITVPRG
ncbi:MAG TPA: hypothetical protein VEZ48_03850 [Sphingomonadaceae bacterium]|nr:hypothetical protein [Sphingomonadaceae bacterium]